MTTELYRSPTRTTQDVLGAGPLNAVFPPARFPFAQILYLRDTREFYMRVGFPTAATAAWERIGGAVAALVPRTWYVNGGAPAGGTGAPGSPFQTIQAGLDACAAGDTVYVASGTYPEALVWPNVDNIALIGSDAGEVIVDAPVGTDTLTWVPPAATVFERMSVRRMILRNGNAGGRCLVLDGDATVVALHAQFLRVLGLFDNVMLDKAGAAGDAAFIRTTGAIEVVHGTGIQSGAPASPVINGWTGKATLRNVGYFAFRGSTLGVVGGGSIDYVYDNALTKPYGGRQGVFLLAATQCYGGVVVGKTPLFVLDPSSTILGDVTDSGLTTFVGPNHAPIIILSGVVGTAGVAASVALALPAMTATGIPFIDCSGGTFYSSAAKPFSVSSLALGISRNYVRGHRARFEGSAAASVIAGADTDLDLRSSFFVQAALSVGVTNGGIDRDSHTVAAVIPAGLVVSPAITPRLPPVSPVFYPAGAPYFVVYELALPLGYPGTSAKLNTGFTTTGTAAVATTAIVQRAP